MGLILTNNHVVMDSNSLTFHHLDDSRDWRATVVATDATHRPGAVKVKATGLTPVTLGDSASIEVGQLAIAIGSPLAPSPTRSRRASFPASTETSP